MPLHETLATRRDRIVARWEDLIRGVHAPAALSTVELRDHIPGFLSTIATALRDDAAALRDEAGLTAEVEVESAAATASAAEHGRQRLRLGFGLDAVVREYGELRHAIVAEAEEAGEAPTFDELHVTFDCIVAGIAHAVTEYSEQRDVELRRQANEHFAFIAHELRNPLSSAITALDVLDAGHLLPQHRAVGALERGLRRTSELISHSLETARIASGIELHRESTSLSALFAEVELDSAADASARGIQIRRTIESDATLSLDLRLVRSALGNLVGNAVKYTSPGTVVELRGRIANERAVIEVEDRCGGLDPAKVERAFVSFVRLETTQDGFGLGLSIAKQAAEAHGGRIRIDNNPGTGCIFVLELPVTPDLAIPDWSAERSRA